MSRRPDLYLPLRSSVEGCAWPAMPDPAGQQVISLLFQFERSQWWPAPRLEQAQYAQLTLLVAHCYDTVPFYRDRLAAVGYRPGQAVTPELWARLPTLDKGTVQASGDALVSAKIPPGHGKTKKRSTSGSTGRPLEVLVTELCTLMWEACTIRDHYWHRRDVTKKLAAIRGRLRGAVYPAGATSPNWGGIVARLYHNGPGAKLVSSTDVAKQALWLQREDPDYLMVMPHTLYALAVHCRDQGIALPRLREVSTYGGLVRPADRAACREAWGVPLVDRYSAEEIGYMALQCPEVEHYHLQAETALVEVLDEAGRACPPGVEGRIVATPLHNFAMPLLRYELGDFAVPGAPCPCGRGLPVIERLVGRLQDIMVLPSGSRIAPPNMSAVLQDFLVAQFQVIQHTPQRLEVKIVPRPGFEAAREAEIRERILERISEPLEIEFSYHEAIPHSPGGKYYEFKSMIDSRD